MKNIIITLVSIVIMFTVLSVNSIAAPLSQSSNISKYITSSNKSITNSKHKTTKSNKQSSNEGFVYTFKFEHIISDPELDYTERSAYNGLIEDCLIDDVEEDVTFYDEDGNVVSFDYIDMVHQTNEY